MGETNKQVRVDNWGIFFLQRLQMFFNKTDYCDLTLQFEGNVQLKVHRLVMSACTEYFNVLEHTCEVIDGNTIIMPDDLQTDVILPIVNFMYTGMLDFNMLIYDKLYKTAELMNIPILTKLLDAQRKPVQRTINRNLAQKSAPRKVHNDLPSQLPGRKVPVWKRKTLPVTPQRTSSPHVPETIIRKSIPSDPLALFDNTPKPTRFEWPDDELDSTFNLIDSSFNDISYTSKPLLTQDDELRASTSFEDLKQSQSVNKKSNNYTNQPVDINDIKDYVKEQKTRAELAECDEEFDCDDPENYLSVKRKPKEEISPEMSAKRVRFNEKENRETTISVTPKNPGEMDHTKIISEVLKKYPHLVKKNKNIKLKIMSKPPAKNELKAVMKSAITKLRLAQKESPKVKIVAKSTKIQQDDEGPWLCRKCPMANDESVEFVLYYLYRKHMTEVHNEKFDPNMCKHCGHQSPKQGMLIYHQYTKHGVLPPPAIKFPKCDRCPFIAMTETMLRKHSLNHSKFELQCTECKVAFNTEHSLEAHMQITGHTGKTGMTNFDCQYCTKRYNTSSDLFSHIKSQHRDEARRDGMVSIDETEYEDEDNQDDEEFLPANIPQRPPPQEEKVNVISNVKVETTVQSTSSDIIGNIGISGTGLVDIVVLDDNQQYILHNDQRLINNQGGYMQIDNSHNLSRNITEVITSQPNVMLQNTEIASTDELVMVLTDHDYNDGNNGILTNDNSNIVVLYSHPVDGQQNQFITSEGKLMLNSQTGMLELRNESTDSQDGQIESIELIQREINSGLLQQGGGVEAEGVAGQEMASAVEGSVEDAGVDYHEEVETGEKVGDGVDGGVVDDGKMIVEEEGDGGGEEVAEGEMMEVEEEQIIQGPVVNSEQKPNALPDLSEDTTEELQIIINEDAVDHPASESMPIEEYHPESGEIQEYPSTVSVETEQDGTETIEHMDTENSEVPAEEVAEETQIAEEGVENSQNPDENVCGEYLGQQENHADSEEAVPEIIAESTKEGLEFTQDSEGENFQVDEASHEVVEEEAPTIIQEEEEMQESAQETIPEEELEPCHEESLPISEEGFAEQPSEMETDTLQENRETIPENEEAILENEETIPENEETIPENVEAQEFIPENHQSIPENQELVPENEESVLENQEIDESMQENEESTQENEESTQENEEAHPEHEETTQENDVEELPFLGTPTVDEENISEEVHQTIEESTLEDVQVDENSQTQDSQTSSSKEQRSDAEKAETSQSTKISILDDWEDTEDSQQSDNTIKKAEITVNRLIDDWDDEDEEGTKKSAEV